MIVSVLILIIGMVLLVKGADMFVSGSSEIARAMKIPPLIIGLTLVSMGTSAPEASVSIISSLKGMNDMSLGNVLGSNIFNTLFILGVSALIAPVAVCKEVKRYDMPFLMFVYVFILLIAFAITPMRLDVFEAASLLMLFVGYTVFLVIRSKSSLTDSKRERLLTAGSNVSSENQCANCTLQGKKIPLWLSLIFTALGLAGIILGGRAVVDSASELAVAWGMSESLVGLTIVAVGTSLPELVTSVVASLKKQNEIAIGNVIGSDIFNIIFILGLSSSICEATFSSSVMFDMLIMLLSGALILSASLFSNKITRGQGALLMSSYIGYLTYIIIRN